jgi:hypothetical protein
VWTLFVTSIPVESRAIGRAGEDDLTSSILLFEKKINHFQHFLSSTRWYYYKDISIVHALISLTTWQLEVVQLYIGVEVAESLLMPIKYKELVFVHTCMHVGVDRLSFEVSRKKIIVDPFLLFLLVHIVDL